MSIVLNPIFSDGVLLQRELPVPVWGSAEPGEHITVSIQGVSASSVADSQGAWRCELPPLAASDVEELVVAGEHERIVVRDVAVGEVFIAGGQSNMEFWMRYERHLTEALETCENPRIRFYDMPKCSYPGQLEDFDFSETRVWRKASKAELERFSAIGYYFACEVEAQLDVPIGIVGCNFGGTRSCAWMAPEHALVAQRPQVEAFNRKLQGLSYEQLLAHGKLNPKNDKGYTTWPAWNEFFLPVTRTEEETRAFFEQEAAKSAEPADVGGLDIGESSAADKSDASTQDELASHPGILTPTKEAPGALYTHMVLPLAPFAARGVLWYQGESDDEDPGAQACHGAALTAIINDWREVWGNPQMAFFVVQLPGYRTWQGVDAQDWPTIRAAQEDVADTMDQVWLCSIGDVGEELDIHPKDKLVPGHRLALLALRHLYGCDILADAPRCTDAHAAGQTIRLCFENAGDGLVIVDDEAGTAGATINSLEVIAEGKAVPFSATPMGSDLVLTLQDMPNADIYEVRFAQDNWHIINLVNSAGIPALPFAITATRVD